MVKSAAHQRKAVSPETAFGLVLRSIRNTRSMSQDDLGAKSGYHRTYIGMLERGEKSPSLRTIFDLASTLGVSPSEIVKQVERLVGKR
jgi:transcriptional regulator with XRE-family HTH domain